MILRKSLNDYGWNMIIDKLKIDIPEKEETYNIFKLKKKY